jgi:acyl transferase domain-containing protein
VQYVECHATGTPLGDVTEFESLKEVFDGQAAARSIRLGGVKELTGHLQAAAGAAGLMKAALALHHKLLPPQHSFQEPAEGIDFQRTPFYISNRETPWPAVVDGPRRASVSAFSFGGISYHLTLEEFSAEYHQHLARTLPIPRPPDPVAIVGLGGVFPQAENVQQLWQNLLRKHCAIGEIPSERAPIDRYLDPTRQSKVRPYTNLAGYIVDGSWPQEQVRVPPKMSSQIDRGHSWTMKAALQSLADAGVTRENVDPTRVGVVMGYLPPLEREFQTQARVYYAEFDGRLATHLRQCGVDEATAARIRKESESLYKSELPPITEDTLLGYLGSLAVGRIAHHLDFQGPMLMVESACASSLAALDIAMNQLRTNQCDLMLVGGMYASLGVDALSQCCSFGGLSQKGSFPFDARADGYITSEGAALIALKRLSDAEAAGDRIYAVVRSVAGATDPKSASIWAPSSEGQVQAVRRAVEKAGVSPTEIQYVEGHGTGTPVGDPIEVETYQAVYGEANTGGKIFLGSVKSNLGHLNSGAGAVALTKVALALHHKQVPPNIGFEKPSPRIPWDQVPFQVPTEVQPWVLNGPGIRRAGVTSFGLGGTSFHAVVEEYQPKPRQNTPRVTGVEPARPPFLGLAGTSRGHLLQQVDHLLHLLQRDPDRDPRGPLGDAALPCRLGMTLPRGQSARKALERARTLLGGTGAPSLPEQGVFFYDTRDSRQLHMGKVAAVFPGQGPQYANMLSELAVEYPIVARTFEEADEVFASMTGRSLTSTFRVPPGSEESYRQDDDTVHAAVFIANVALYRLIRAQGVRVDVLLGQSAGEYAALAASGMLSFEHALRAIYRRTLAVTRLPVTTPGQMLSISGDFDKLRQFLSEARGYVTVAAENAPGQGIVAGEAQAVESVAKWCRANGFEVRVLPVSHAYHTQLIAGAVPIFRAELERLSWHEPELPVLSSVHGRYYASPVEARFMARHLALQYVMPVRFGQHVRQLHDEGVRLFIEAGPKWSLTAFIQASLKGMPYLAQASNHPKIGEIEQFHRLLAFSYVHHLLRG